MGMLTYHRQVNSTPRGVAWIAMILPILLVACTGKVAEVAAVAGASSSIRIISTTLNNIQVGDVATGVTTSGGMPPLVFKVTGGALPDGLSLDATTGNITGRIAPALANQSYAVSITVSDNAGASSSASFAGSISPGLAILSLATSTIGDFVAGISYSYPLVVLGGTAPYKFTLTSGTLPSGVTLNSSTGLISGLPAAFTANQAIAIVVSVSDSTSQTASKTFINLVRSSTASSFAIITPSIPTPASGVNYGASIGLTGGTAPFSFAIVSGSLPAGLSINASSGLISGTVALAAQGASFLFTVRVTDALGLQSSQSYNGMVSTYSTAMFPSSLINATPGQAYNAAIVAVNGQSPYTYAITAGILPIGLSLDGSTGVISGTVAPSEAGLTKSFSISSIDANGIQSTSSLSITTALYVVTLNTASLSSAVEGSAYSNQSTPLNASGGTGPYSFEYSGSLPAGVGLTSAGVFFGVPSDASGALNPGTDYVISVRARDSLNQVSANVALTLNVGVTPPVVTSATLPVASLGNPYSASLSATGGRAPYVFAVTSGVLPTGLSLSSDGVITGTATTSFSCPASSFGVRVTDALPQAQISSERSMCIATVSGVAITNSALPTVVYGVSYSGAITVSGGTAPFTYSASGLPAGLTINSSTGIITGFSSVNPSTDAVTDFMPYFSVTDHSTPPLTTTRAISVVVRNSLVLAGGTLPRAATGIAYNGGAGYQVAATGGQAPYSYVITSGSLPYGLSMSTSGLISGSPGSYTAANGGSYAISMVATDSVGQSTATANFTLNVTVAPKIVNTSLAIAVVSTPYAVDLKRSGGVNLLTGSANAPGQITWSLESPASLPSGLTLDGSRGRIYGTPGASTAGSYALTLKVADQYGFYTTKTLTLTISSTGKTMSLKSARISDPCTGAGYTTAPLNCLSTSAVNSGAYAIDQLNYKNSSVTPEVNIQQFLVTPRNELTPKAIQIAKIDATGRVPVAATSTISTQKFDLPANVSSVVKLRIADLDQDGYKDIIFTDQVGKQVCVAWNGNGSATPTPSATNMPNITTTGFNAANVSCFPIPTGNATSSVPYEIQVRNDLRPDATNYGKQDVIVSSSAGSGTTVFVLNNLCAPGASCASIRDTIFAGYSSATATVTNASASISAFSSNIWSATITGPLVNNLIPISGVGIPAGATFNTVTATNAVTISANANATGTRKLTWPAITAVQTATVTSGTATFTVSSASGISKGQLVSASNAIILPGTYVKDVSGTTITVSPAPSGATGSYTLVFFGPSAHTPILTTAANHYMRDSHNLGAGWFMSAKPNLPTVKATGVNDCPGIAVAGGDLTTTGNGYIYVMRQTWTGTQCAGDFVTHTSTDESSAITGTAPFLGGVAVADFNGDRVSDIAVANGIAQANSGNIKIFVPAVGLGFFSGSTSVMTAQLQSVTNSSTSVSVTTGASKLMAYCMDGSSACDYPALVATCGRDLTLGAAGSGTAGCLAIFKNSCTTTPCSTPFTNGTPSDRIDYSSPTGQSQEPTAIPLVSTTLLRPTAVMTSGSNQLTVSDASGISKGMPVSAASGIAAGAYVTDVSGSTVTISSNATVNNSTAVLTLPALPTRNDLAFVGMDQSSTNYSPYFAVYARNGSSTTNPLQGATAFNGMPKLYGQIMDTGTLKITDMNADGTQDLLAFSPNNGTVSAFVSNNSGPTVYGVGVSQNPAYLSDTTTATGGCLLTDSFCFPDPVFNSMGINQGTPVNTFTNQGVQPSQNVMDVADVNNDSLVDVLAVGYGSHSVSVALGTSNGDFGATSTYEMGLSGADMKPTTAIFTDLDQDGFPDIVVAGINATSSNATVMAWLKGNGDGTFAAASVVVGINQCGLSTNSFRAPQAIHAVDLDQDGRPEISMLCLASSEIYISRRTHNSWFHNSTNINNQTGTNASGMRWGRLTTSGATGFDLVVSGFNDTATSLKIINNWSLTVTDSTSGSFNMPATNGAYMAMNSYITDVEIADFNADGYGDVAFTTDRRTNIANNGELYTCMTDNPVVVGSCTKQGWGMDGNNAFSLAVGDVNNDNLPDLFVGYQSPKLFYRTITRYLNSSW